MCTVGFFQFVNLKVVVYEISGVSRTIMPLWAVDKYMAQAYMQSRYAAHSLF